MTWHSIMLAAATTALAGIPSDHHALLLSAPLFKDASSLLALAAPLLAVPLGAMTFYLRSIREQQVTGHADIARRLEHVECGLRRLVRRVSEDERNFTSKEDWLRESMLARHNIERLTEASARMEAALDLTSLASDRNRNLPRAVVRTGPPDRRGKLDQD